MSRTAQRPAYDSLLRALAIQEPVEYTKFIEDGTGNLIRYVKFGDGELILRDERDGKQNPIRQELIFGFEELRREPADLISETGLNDTLTALKRKAQGKPEAKVEQIRSAKA